MAAHCSRGDLPQNDCNILNRRGHVRDAEQGSFVRMRVPDGVLVGEVDPTFDFESRWDADEMKSGKKKFG